MAGRAGAPGAVQVDAADTLVGPAGDDGKVHLAEVGVAGLGAGDVQPRAVAVQAAHGLGRRIGSGEAEPALVDTGAPRTCLSRSW